MTPNSAMSEDSVATRMEPICRSGSRLQRAIYALGHCDQPTDSLHTAFGFIGDADCPIEEFRVEYDDPVEQVSHE